MKTRQILLLACLATLSPKAAAQTQRSPINDRIQSTFRAVDLDKNGTISPREAAKAGIKTRSFAFHDKNKDRRLASDEFQAYYTKLVAQQQAERERRQKEALERERKQAEAKQKREEAAKREAASPKDQPQPNQPEKPAPGVPGATPQRGGSPNQPGTPAGPLEGAAAGNGKAAGGAQKPTQKPTANPSEVPAVANRTTTPTRVTRKPKRGQADPAKLDSVIKPGASKASQKTDAQLLKDEQAARSVVQRLIASKQISAQEGRDMVQSISVGVRGQNGTIGLTEWRTALNNSKTRVTALVRSGVLSAEEGRAMYDLFEERARRAVLASQPGKPAESKEAGAKPNAKPETKPQTKPGVQPVAQPNGVQAKDFRKGNEDLAGLTEAQLQKLQQDAERIQNAREATRLQNYRNALRAHNARENLRKAEEEKVRKRKQAALDAERKRLEEAKQNARANGESKARNEAKPSTRGEFKPQDGASKAAPKKPVDPQAKPGQAKPAQAKPGKAAPQKQAAPKEAAASKQKTTPDAAKRNATGKDAAKRNAAKAEAAKRDAAKQDAAKRDAAKKDSAKKDAAKREAAKKAAGNSTGKGTR